jgi:hypothetical protein
MAANQQLDPIRPVHWGNTYSDYGCFARGNGDVDEGTAAGLKWLLGAKGAHLRKPNGTMSPIFKPLSS